MIQVFKDYLSFEREKIEEKPWKLVKKTFLKKPLLHSILILLSGGYHLLNLWRRANRSINNTKAARKVIFCLEAQQKIEQMKSGTARKETLIGQAKQVTIGIHRLDEIYSHEELLNMIDQPVNETALLPSTYFLQKPIEAWSALRQKHEAPCDIDRINIYYEELKDKRSLSHDDVIKLVDRKIQGRGSKIVSLEELDDVFQDLLDDVL